MRPKAVRRAARFTGLASTNKGRSDNPNHEELGARIKAGVWDRYRDLPGLRRGGARHCIEDPVVIGKILAHLDAKVAEPEATRRRSSKNRREGERCVAEAVVGKNSGL